MPSKNTVKIYVEGGTYHIYNRGNNVETIFKKEKDYHMFQYLLKRYLLSNKFSTHQIKNYYGEIFLYSYVLMPTHYHFLLKQKHNDSMERFMSSLCTSYSGYMHRKNGKVGRLFQSRYKARIITGTYDFINVSRYIHNNPVGIGANPMEYPHTSLQNYTGTDNGFVDTKEVLYHFNYNTKSYINFLNEEDSPL